MHGQSDYTPTKQRHLSGLLSTCRQAWRPGKQYWKHSELILIDCTAGSGYSEKGEKGSPLILQEYAIYYSPNAYRLLCCEINKARATELKQTMVPNERLSIVHGAYQNVVPEWLEEQGIKPDKPALGLIYIDANGAKDLVEGYEMLEGLKHDRRFNRIDLVFHWSLTAYNRNLGANNAWAVEPLIEMCERLCSLKRHWYAREPIEKWKWVFMHGLNTDAVRPKWRKERIVKLEEWIAKLKEPEQIAIFS